MVFDAIGNGIIFLISFSDCLLLVHRNKIEFGVLIFYPTILLNLIISQFQQTFVDSLDFLHTGSCHLQIGEFYLHLSFQTSFLLLLFVCLFVCLFLPYCTYQSFQNNAEWQRPLCSWLQRENIQSFHSRLSMMLAVVFIDGLFGLRRPLVLLICYAFLSRMRIPGISATCIILFGCDWIWFLTVCEGFLHLCP